MSMMNNALVLGGSHHNTLGVVRALGRMGVMSDIIICDGGNDSFVAKSCYAASCRYVKDEEDALVLMLSEAEGDRQVVFSCSDRFSAFLARHKEELQNRYLIPGSDSDEGLVYWMNKENMATAARECGLDVPGVGTRQFPIMAKPMSSINGKKDDICILHNAEELKNYRIRYQNADVQYQQFIHKHFEYQLIGCSLNGGDEVCIPGVAVIIRQPHNTNTGFLRYAELDDTYPVEQCRKFLQRIKYSGLFSMEFLRGKDGKDYFMEINLRNDGNAICVTDAGVNLPYMWYQHCLGMEVPQQKIHPLYCMPEFDDLLKFVLKGKISIFKWIKDIRMSESFMEYAPDDKRPFYGRLSYEFKRLVKKTYKQLTNWRWEIGFVQNDMESVLRGGRLKMRWVKLPFRDRWFADPFILDVTDDQIVLLAEEYSDALKKGRIAKLTIDRHTYGLLGWKILLELPTHLSFPAILRDGDEVYVYPENSESGKLTLYKYNKEKDSMDPVRFLCEEPLTDAVLHDGKWLLSTQLPDPNNNILDIRNLQDGTKKSVTFGDKLGRNAGDLFECGGKTYRPAQESNGEYGHAVELQEVGSEWTFTPVRRMTSPHPCLKLGMHTWNTYKGLTVIDVKGYRHVIIGTILKTLKKLLIH